MKSFEVTITHDKKYPDVAVIFFKGRMESGTINKIRQTVDQIIKDGKKFVVGDLSEVISISSAAIGELMGCRTSLIECDGDLVLGGAILDVQETLTALDANKIFKMYKDVRSATNFYYWEYQGQVETISLSFPSELSFVPPVRQLVRRIANQKKYSDKDAFRIETIVDEICNNAIEHGSCSENDEVDVTVSIDRKKIEIKVTNTSDVEKIDSLMKMSKYLATPKASFHEKRGRGLALVKMLSNDFKIDSSGGGTCVHVTKLREG